MEIKNESALTAVDGITPALEGLAEHLAVLRSQFRALPLEKQLSVLTMLVGVAAELSYTYRLIGGLPESSADAFLKAPIDTGRRIGGPIVEELRRRIASEPAALEMDVLYAAGMVRCFEMMHDLSDG